MHTKSLGTLKKMLVQRDEKRKSRLDLTALDSQKSGGSGQTSGELAKRAAGYAALEKVLAAC